MTVSLPVKVTTELVSNHDDQKVFYPQVGGLTNQSLIRSINRDIVVKTQRLIDQQSEAPPSAITEMIGYYEIKNNERQSLSFLFSNYTYYEKAAHGMTIIDSLTYDLSARKRVKLRDLFKKDSNYKERINDLIKEQIKRRQLDLLTDFTSIKNDNQFYIADKTLVIYFQLYELMAYVYGFPLFPIVIYDLQDIIDESGLLGRQIASP